MKSFNDQSKHFIIILIISFISLFLTTPTYAAKRLRGSIRIDGSSTVYPITEAVAEEFAEVAQRVKIPMLVSGTGGGFKRFVIGETDISNASRPIKAKELKKANEKNIQFIEIPIAYDGLTIVVNKQNTWVKELNIKDLKKIFLDGTNVKSWKDLNENYPDVEIKIYAPGTDSGTFDYFKEQIAGKKGSIRDDMSISEDDNILVRAVSGHKGAIGFFGCAYYFENQNKLKAVPINNGKKAVLPSPQNIENGSYAPFSRPLFIYVNAKSIDKPEVNAFIQFYFEQGPKLAEEVGYVKLPSKIYARAKEKYKARFLGTNFLDKKGNKIHGPLTTVFKPLKPEIPTKK